MADVRGKEATVMRDELGVTQNPGPISQSVFEEDTLTIVDNHVGWWTCSGRESFGIVLQFERAASATI